MPPEAGSGWKREAVGRAKRALSVPAAPDAPPRAQRFTRVAAVQHVHPGNTLLVICTSR
jgi:hypothetical protein